MSNQNLDLKPTYECVKNAMNPNQFMHQNQILDDVERSSDTIPQNQNLFMLIWMVSEDLPIPFKWQF